MDTNKSEALKNATLLQTSLGRLGGIMAAEPALSASAPLPEVIASLQGNKATSIEVFARACETYADRPALGERAFVLEDTSAGRAVRYLPEFRTIDYKTTWQRTVALATGLVRDARTALKVGEVVGIYGFGSIDYVIADMACLYAGLSSAVLQTSMRSEDLTHIVNEAQYASIICSRESLTAVLEVLPACPSVRSLVVMDVHPEAAVDVAALAQATTLAKQVKVVTIHELSSAASREQPLAPFIPAPDTDPLTTLMYTSGSTGFPKGAMITESVWRTYWQLTSFNHLIHFPNIGINFYPLSHVMGRNAVVRTLVQGGTMSFTLKSDMSTLFEDIRLVRPTLLDLVPRISETIYQAYRTEVMRKTKAGQTQAEAQAAVRRDMGANFLGNRLLAAFTGSAPTAPEVLEFLKSCFQIPIYEGYGSTEAGVLTIEDKISRPTVSAYKLVDVPELGYRTSDKPYPRGELLVKSRRSVPGYFHNKAATEALYDADGFLRTGDIVEERGADHVVWVDRKNNVMKLAQGEFVTIWRLETVFNGGSPYLEQVYLYANSQRSYLLAVIVPALAAVTDRLQQQGKEATPAAIKQVLRGEVNRIAGEAKLRSYEIPRDFLVELEPWTRDNGLLTGVNKPARPQLKKKYGARLEALYVDLEEQQQQEIAALSQAGAEVSVAHKVQKALEAVLSIQGVDLNAGSFKDLGGDSLSALSLATLLEEICGVAVPVAAILNPGATLQGLVRQIEAKQAGDTGPLATFEGVHGKGAQTIRGEDLKLEKFLSEAELSAAAKLDAPKGPVKSVLLTGANGFLGRFLCLEWLEQMAKVEGKVYAVIRAPNDQAAFARLESIYHSGDAVLIERFTSLAAKHLVVLAGDLGEPSLGLKPEVYEELAANVDLIVHPGALVNHVFTYEQLFGPNVLGTAELIRLSLYKRRKRFDYVSTIGVLAGAIGEGKVPELKGVDALQKDWPVTGGYAHGYATSKWASEVLLKALHERFATPVRVFRPDMILPHRRFRGQANGPDMLTRLLASVVYTGLAPRSFYAAGQSSKAHYDGLPVDFIAAAMVDLSSAFQSGYATYQVSNANWDDGVSLDSMIDWVASAGYPLERVADYDTWFKTFSGKLEALPAAERAHSSLPILHQWAKPTYNWENDRVDASQFRLAVQQHKPAGDKDIPHLSEGYVHKYLADMQELAIIKA